MAYNNSDFICISDKQIKTQCPICGSCELYSLENKDMLFITKSCNRDFDYQVTISLNENIIASERFIYRLDYSNNFDITLLYFHDECVISYFNNKDLKIFNLNFIPKWNFHNKHEMIEKLSNKFNSLLAIS